MHKDPHSLGFFFAWFVEAYLTGKIAYLLLLPGYTIWLCIPHHWMIIFFSSDCDNSKCLMNMKLSLSGMSHCAQSIRRSVMCISELDSSKTMNTLSFVWYCCNPFSTFLVSSTISVLCWRCCRIGACTLRTDSSSPTHSSRAALSAYLV